jgi:hypothetical protein
VESGPPPPDWGGGGLTLCAVSAAQCSGYYIYSHNFYRLPVVYSASAENLYTAPQTWAAGLSWPAADAGFAAGQGLGVQKTPGRGKKRFQPPAQVSMTGKQWPKFLQVQQEQQGVLVAWPSWPAAATSAASEK